MSLLLLILLSASPSTTGRCAAAPLHEADQLATGSTRDDVVGTQALVAEAIGEACKSTLPERLTRGLESLTGDGSVIAATSARVVADTVRDDPSRWRKACRGGFQALSASAMAPDRRGALFDACGWSTLPLGTREEFQHARSPELAVIVFHALVEDARVAAPLAGRLARAIGAFQPTGPASPSERTRGSASGRLGGGGFGTFQQATPHPDAGSPGVERPRGVGGIGATRSSKPKPR